MSNAIPDADIHLYADADCRCTYDGKYGDECCPRESVYAWGEHRACERHYDAMHTMYPNMEAEDE